MPLCSSCTQMQSSHLLCRKAVLALPGVWQVLGGSPAKAALLRNMQAANTPKEGPETTFLSVCVRTDKKTPTSAF